MSENRGDASTVLAIGALGALGWVGYRYWYVPNALNERLRADAARLQAQRPGLSQRDAFAQVASIGCQAYAASYGLPPLATGEMCGLIGGAASQLVRGLPGVAKTVALAPVKIVGGVAGEVAKPFKAVARDVGKAASSVGKFFNKLF